MKLIKSVENVLQGHPNIISNTECVSAVPTIQYGMKNIKPVFVQKISQYITIRPKFVEHVPSD